ncbi:MAG: hypothetical protein F4W95_01505 [Chloroflexi bacterium]|nr:hypothetical protein [Chloroflexota bacterium]MYD47142.1 hypothetical protein [Chloroflexota bacterium]
MQSIKSPWAPTFDQFAGSIRESAIIAAPYITRQPVERLAGKLRSRSAWVRLDVLTNLHADSLIDGSLDIGALAWLCDQIPGTTVRHLRYLHAKAYVADEHTAIVTSANLTNGGLRRNRELGVAITDPDGVRDIADDLREYGNLGVLVPAKDLAELDAMAEQAQISKAAADSAIPISVAAGYDAIRNDMNERLVRLRTAGEAFTTNPRMSITAQFCDAIRYVLRQHGPMSTRDMNPLIQNLLPELCDDEVDRIINGVRFGRKWKHQVRNAQVQLRRDGTIVQEGGRNSTWRLS